MTLTVNLVHTNFIRMELKSECWILFVPLIFLSKDKNLNLKLLLKED